jgi:hypothetical protein
VDVVVSGPVVVVLSGSVVVVVDVLDVVVVGGAVTVNVAVARSPLWHGGAPFVQAVTVWFPVLAPGGTVNWAKKPLLGLTVAEVTGVSSK